tara:strand:- start:412 stop:588 length:177 start_codon:yes stop_codon:yes gene_type:complete
MENFKTRLEEFKVLNTKRNPSKGYMQGLNLKDYDRINSLHSFLMSSEEGKLEYDKIKK